MVYKIKKLFLKIASIFKLIVINILFITILFLFSESAISSNTDVERNLAYKYCKSIESNMFKGLDNERILRNEYFFNSIKKEDISEVRENIANFTSEVENTCSYKLGMEEKEDFRKGIQKYFSDN